MSAFTLTLNFDDPRMMADTIADLLNVYREAHVSITLDEMISPDHPEYVPTAAERADDWNKRHGFNEWQERDIAKAERKAKRLAEREEWFRNMDPAELAARAEANEEKRRLSERATMNSACPTCGSPAGERCITESNLSYSWHNCHVARRRQIDELDNVWQDEQVEAVVSKLVEF